MNIDHQNPDALLAIPLDQPKRLFPLAAREARDLKRKLNTIWHPDRNPHPRAARVFSHLQALYESATACGKRATLDAGNELRITSTSGRCYRLRYRRRTETDIGQRFVGRHVMYYLVAGDNITYARDGYQRISNLPFADEAMRESMARQLPACHCCVNGRDLVLLVLRKPADFVPLDSLQRHLGGSLAPRHVAWVLSGLFNLACYLQWAGLCHMAIAAEHCLVSPAGHSVALIGGWWCAQHEGQPLRLLPARSVRLAPPDILHKRIADPRLDAALIRQMGFELLGDRAGEAPAAMLDFLSIPGSGSAVTDYQDWQKTLRASFGGRRFCSLGVCIDDIGSIA